MLRASAARSSVRTATTWLAALTTSLLAACGGGDGGTTAPPPVASISVSVGTASLTLGRGTSGTSAITVARTNYSGTVTLTATGAPAGVTVDVAPSSLTSGATAATATVSVSSSATPGTYTIIVLASGTGVSSSGTISLTIPNPTITLTAGSSTASVVQGASTTVPVTITRGGGFTDAVTLAVSGLPTGVTATFNPASIASGSTTSTLTLTAAANATAGTSALTITASGTGVTAQTATVNLTVTASATPAIAVAAAPAALSVQAGATGTSTVTLTRTGGFAGDVALALSGAPTGVTGAFAPASIAAGATTSTLTLTVGAATAPGVYNLTVTGTGTGVTAATTTVALTVTAVPSIAITANPTTISLAAGATITSVITLARTNFTADVALAATNLPTGVTAAFSPATLSGGTLTSTLTLTAAANASLLTQNITVTASGTGVSNATAILATTVTAAQSYTLAATAATVQQGATGTSTITVTRTGGYAGAVTLTVGALPTGVTATVSPSSVTGTSATVTFTAAANAATGASNVTITGAGAGLTGNVTTTVPLTVTASGGGGTGNVNLRFCDLSALPSFVAYRSGSSGAWTRATAGANNTYSFTITGVGGMAWVTVDAQNSPTVNVWYGSAAELTTTASSQCTTNAARKSHTGTFAGVGPTQTGQVALGGSLAQGSTGGSTYSIQNVLDGATDLIAFRSSFSIVGSTVATVPDRGVIRRNVNYANGAAIPVIDFGGAESFVPASATVTVANAAGASQVIATASLLTGNGSTIGGFTFGTFGGSSATNTVYGLPAALTQSTDLHVVSASAITLLGGTTLSEQRTATQFNRLLADRTLTLGPSLLFPTLTTITTTPYARVRAVGNWQAEYGDQIFAIFSQRAGGVARGWSVFATRAYFSGANSYDFDVPDFSGVSGWNNAWGLVGGTAVDVSAFATSAGGGVTSIEGLVSRSAARFGTYTP